MLLNFCSSMKKQTNKQKIRMIFDVVNSLWKSNFGKIPIGPLVSHIWNIHSHELHYYILSLMFVLHCSLAGSAQQCIHKKSMFIRKWSNVLLTGNRLNRVSNLKIKWQINNNLAKQTSKLLWALHTYKHIIKKIMKLIQLVVLLSIINLVLCYKESPGCAIKSNKGY